MLLDKENTMAKVASCFDNDKYLKIQSKEILRRLSLVPQNGSVYLEFGGKPFDDRHAARVLPGYDADLKLRLLKELSGYFELVMVVSARDILKPRIRGDSQLFYNEETLRLVSELAKIGLKVKSGVISMVKDDYPVADMRCLDNFVQTGDEQLGITFEKHSFIKGYPFLDIFEQDDVFQNNPKIVCRQKNVLILSPGGGSGKFGVCLSQLFHDFNDGKNSIYLKFETFPVFDLPPEHPINLAFLAATADLGNILHRESPNGLTTYDKDLENLSLLLELVKRYCPNLEKNPMSKFIYPSDMGVNKLTTGF